MISLVGATRKVVTIRSVQNLLPLVRNLQMKARKSICECLFY